MCFKCVQQKAIQGPGFVCSSFRVSVRTTGVGWHFTCLEGALAWLYAVGGRTSITAVALVVMLGRTLRFVEYIPGATIRFGCRDHDVFFFSAGEVIDDEAHCLLRKQRWDRKDSLYHASHVT